jgi:hypothetical protein
VAADAEITVLTLCLQRQRNHVLGAVAGLSDEALRRPVLPSGWSCLGVVQHLTPSVERCGCGLWWPCPGSGWRRLPNLRDVRLHVITETACHGGHLDAVRELIDGQQWLVNT